MSIPSETPVLQTVLINTLLLLRAEGRAGANSTHVKLASPTVVTRTHITLPPHTSEAPVLFPSPA